MLLLFGRNELFFPPQILLSMEKTPSTISEGIKKDCFTNLLSIIKDVFSWMYTFFFLYLDKSFLNFYRPTSLFAGYFFQNSNGSIIKALASWYRLGLVVGSKNLTHELY